MIEPVQGQTAARDTASEPTRVKAAEALAHALEHTEGPLDPSWSEEVWVRSIVSPSRLRTAHSDFRGVPITKNELLADVLNRSREDIEAGVFPEAERIRSGEEHLPAVMLEADGAGQLFVADGQCRVLCALWNGIDEIDSYVYHRPGTRELP